MANIQEINKVAGGRVNKITAEWGLTLILNLSDFLLLPEKNTNMENGSKSSHEYSHFE